MSDRQTKFQELCDNYYGEKKSEEMVEEHQRKLSNQMADIHNRQRTLLEKMKDMVGPNIRQRACQIKNIIFIYEHEKGITLIDTDR